MSYKRKLRRQYDRGEISYFQFTSRMITEPDFRKLKRKIKRKLIKQQRRKEMKSQFEKYAHLQQTIWPKFATTTLGNLPAEQAKKIDAEYDRVIAIEAKGEKAEVTEPALQTEKGEAVNIVADTPSESADVGATQDGPASGIKTHVSESEGSNVASEAAPVADQANDIANFGENDENEVTQEEGVKGQP